MLIKFVCQVWLQKEQEIYMWLLQCFSQPTVLCFRNLKDVFLSHLFGQFHKVFKIWILISQKKKKKSWRSYFSLYFRPRLKGRNRIEWKGNKRIILKYSLLSLFESFNRGNGKFIPFSILLFGSLSGRESNM